MRRRRRLCVFLFLSVLMLGFRPARAVASAAPTPATLLYFFENYCASCAPEQDFLRDYAALTGSSAVPADCAFYNLRYPHHRAAWEAAIATYRIPPERQRLPMVILNGVVYAGTEQIQTALPADFLRRSGASDSVVYYFYVPACQSCAQAAAALDALPAEVAVTRGGYAFVSRVRVERIDLSADPSLALAMFDAYHVPEAARVAPIAFVRQQYFSGSEAIAQGLAEAVRQGAAVGNAWVTAPLDPPPALSWGATALAGLIGGLNPCALSMLLLFLSLLLPLTKQAGRCAAIFLLSKFACYLAIGTVLLSAWQAWNPAGLTVVLKWGLMAYCAVLLVLNVWDAWAAHRAAYGQIRNQLPARLRARLQQYMARVLASPRRLLPAAALLGVAVAGGEFLCAGQVYLATLLATLRAAASWRSLALLAVYCAAFLLPGAALCAVLLRGKAVFAVSDWVRRRLPLLKLVTALFFAGLLLYLGLSG